MAKKAINARRPPRTVRKGLREVKEYKGDNFPVGKVEKWDKIIQKLLSNNAVPDEKNNFLKEYILSVCEFRINKDQASYEKIRHLEDKGERIGFNIEDLGAINRVFLNRPQEELKEVIQTIGDK
ncbi:MAG: hypothetical protein ABH800_00345 [Candidatus Nealsonbacteria bacterium]